MTDRTWLDDLEEWATLFPAEKMALTVAVAQVGRGDEVPPNTTAALVFALKRLASVGEEMVAVVRQYVDLLAYIGPPFETAALIALREKVVNG